MRAQLLYNWMLPVSKCHQLITWSIASPSVSSSEFRFSNSFQWSAATPRKTRRSAARNSEKTGKAELSFRKNRRGGVVRKENPCFSFLKARKKSMITSHSPSWNRRPFAKRKWWAETCWRTNRQGCPIGPCSGQNPVCRPSLWSFEWLSAQPTGMTHPAMRPPPFDWPRSRDREIEGRSDKIARFESSRLLIL